MFHLGKDIENRDWPTNFRGRVAIHASARIIQHEYEDACRFIHELSSKHLIRPGVVLPKSSEYDLGAIIGTVEIVDCVTASSSRWFVGEYGFVLRDPVRLKTPIPIKGKLSFWEVPKDLLFHICERCGRSRDGHSRAMLMNESGACERFQGEYEC